MTDVYYRFSQSNSTIPILILRPNIHIFVIVILRQNGVSTVYTVQEIETNINSECSIVNNTKQSVNRQKPCQNLILVISYTSNSVRCPNHEQIAMNIIYCFSFVRLCIIINIIDNVFLYVQIYNKVGVISIRSYIQSFLLFILCLLTC